MKLFIILASLLLCACEQRFAASCCPWLGEHTKQEWNEISNRNWKFIDCLNVHNKMSVGKADALCRLKLKAKKK